MSFRSAQKHPSGMSAGQRLPRTHDCPHELQTSAPSRGLPLALYRMPITTMQWDQLPPRGRNPSASLTLVVAKPTLEQIGTGIPFSIAAASESHESQRATPWAVCSLACFARAAGTPFAPHSFDNGMS